MGRTAPAPDAPAPPGMAPGTAVKAGGGTGGGGGGKGAGSGGGGSGGGPGGDGSGGAGGDQGAGAGSPDGEKYKPCGTKSCPIDVGTGRMYTLAEHDLYLPGPIPLSFYRMYSSFARRRDVGLGHGWVHSYAWEVVVTPTKTVVWTNTGTWENFPLLEAGQEAHGKWGWILRRDRDGFVLDTNEGIWRVLRQSQADATRYRLTEEYDRNGNRIRLDYAAGVLTEITDSVGRMVRVGATNAGRIASLSVKNGAAQGKWIHFARYEYDDAGNLIRATDADGFSNRYAYDGDGRHLMVENGYKTGLVFYFRYDRQFRCVESWGAYPGKVDPSLAPNLPTKLADGQTPIKGVHHVRVEYFDDGMRHAYDSRRTETYLVNQHGLLDMADIGGATSTATFRDDGFVLSQTDALGNTTSWERDARGNVVSATNRNGYTTKLDRDDSGLITRVTGPHGHTTELMRDARGNVEQVRAADGTVTVYKRDQRGYVTEYIDGCGHVTNLTWDASANLAQLRLPNGETWQHGYDAFGRIVATTDPTGVKTTVAYSDRGDRISDRDGSGDSAQYLYDGDRRLIQIIDAMGAVTKLVHGGLRVLVERIDANGHRVRLRYNHDADLVSIENEGGELHQLHHDAHGHLIGEETFDGRHIRYQNDLLGRAVTVQNGAGEVTSFTWDAQGQLVARELADGSVEAFAYDGYGDMVKATGRDASVEIQRDAMRRIVRETQIVDGDAHWIDLRYDGEGHRIERATSRGHIEAIQRSPLGNRSATLLDGKHRVGHVADAMGREIARLLPRGGRIETAYDSEGMVSRRRVLGKSAGIVGDIGPDWHTPPARGVTSETSYAYRLDGELATELDGNRGATSYEYDLVGQLLARLPARAREERFRFDPRGNVHEAGAGDPGRSYGKGNRLLRKGDTHYRWDDEGRLVEKRIAHPATSAPDEVWRYGWNAAGMLEHVERPDGARVRLRYDPFGRRISKEVVPGGSALGASKTWFVWDEDVIAHEIRARAMASGDPVVDERTYVFDDGDFSPVAHLESGEWYHYVNDANGAPDRLIDDAGDLACELDRSAWGMSTNGSPSRATTPILFQGQVVDPETGLAYNRYRYYAPEEGRYISQDPTLLRGGLNATAYALNPIGWVDPYGLNVSTGAGRTHVTYRGTKGGKPYSGYASAPSSLGLTDEEIVARRYGDDFSDFDAVPEPTYCGTGVKGKQTARGLEQHQHDENVAAAGGDTDEVANRQNPVGPNNKNKEKYETAAQEELDRRAAEAAAAAAAAKKKKKKK